MRDVAPRGGKGALYAVALGEYGFGIFNDWATCGVTGHSGAVYRKIEYNPNTPAQHLSEKNMASFGQARAACLSFLAARCEGAEQVAVQAVIDAERCAAVEAAAEKKNRLKSPMPGDPPPRVVSLAASPPA
jgi:hypothetical protein